MDLWVLLKKDFKNCTYPLNLEKKINIIFYLNMEYGVKGIILQKGSSGTCSIW